LFLAYFDDSGSHPSSDICVYGGVVIPGDRFGFAEDWSNVVVGHLGIDGASFKEFKAGDLYFAKGVFSGLDQARCRECFLLLLNMLNVHRLPFIYSAVDRRRLQQEPLLGSKHPVDLAFGMCLN